MVARFVHTEEVTGSNPVSPTSPKWPLTCEYADSADITFAAINHRLAIRRDRQTVTMLDVEKGAVQSTAQQACQIGERLGWTTAGFNDAGYLELGYALHGFGLHTILDQEEGRQPSARLMADG